MDSTNGIENAAVAQRWGFPNACSGWPWCGLDVSKGLSRSACERRVDLHTDRCGIPTEHGGVT
jgi:hypothetical protein